MTRVIVEALRFRCSRLVCLSTTVSGGMMLVRERPVSGTWNPELWELHRKSDVISGILSPRLHPWLTRTMIPENCRLMSKS